MNCPNCQAPIEQDFGMVTCHQCQHLFFVDVDGHAQPAENGNQEAINQFSEDQSFAVTSEPDAFVAVEHTENELLQMPQVEEGPGPLASVSQIEEALQDSTAEAPNATLSLDVTEFANSNATGLSYHLVIDRIDTGEIRNMLSAALSDDRFGWDVRDLMGSIKEGHLEIRNINPAKLIVLMNRLRKVPVSVNWSQSVYEAN